MPQSLYVFIAIALLVTAPFWFPVLLYVAAYAIPLLLALMVLHYLV